MGEEQFDSQKRKQYGSAWSAVPSCEINQDYISHLTCKTILYFRIVKQIQIGNRSGPKDHVKMPEECNFYRKSQR